MALIKCPECQLQVSDKALSCPHCGYPINQVAIQRHYKKPGKKETGFQTALEVSRRLKGKICAILFGCGFVLEKQILTGQY